MADTVVQRLNDNINATSNDPAVALDQRLFDEAELVVTQSLPAETRLQLVASLSSLLPKLQQDPTPAVDLLLKLVAPFSFSEVLQLGNVPFTEGLAVGEHMIAFNRLILALLRKATHNAGDAATLAGMLDTVLALVRLWLCTSDTGITSQSHQVLLDLLKVDQQRENSDAHVPTGGQGLFWKRIFGDRDVYRLFFEACSPIGPSSLKLNKSQRTLAQARLMEWLPKVAAMDWNAASKSHHSEIEAEYKVTGGLLDLAASHMVDTKDDVLMHQVLINFYSDILRATTPAIQLPGSAADSAGLRYLVTQGIHARTAAIYIQLPGVQFDPLESMFLYGPAAHYIATYASEYPDHFLASQMPKQVLDRLGVALDLSAAKWAHSDPPKHDLHLLTSLPRKALLASAGTAGWRSSPLSLLPSKSTNSDVLNTLAAVFHGPPGDLTFRSGTMLEQDPAIEEEARQARALYYHYVANNAHFWEDIARHADTVALKDVALAAINCLTAVITAHWNEAETCSLPTTLPTPTSGHLAILSPPALEYALPYLLKPPQTFANIVGGRGDAESSVYKIASAKFDALKAFQVRLASQVDQTPGQGFEDILTTINKRLAEGPLSREGDIGGQVGTIEL
ncbi:hypothetical protein DOTSEDRAFT_90231 [Dothistroma septosporum NZE10]|uniref:DNA mismatch repair protein HSM3 N-terminal domain-containing protein n=1 Tax=Dothistroma septosporum (strain NZE10 / CBS 128990) TaxID=675120 RepID=N1PG61_DOTSN|nr:hypothetical protein DOTSEDRAFT_90231 [Dothistroma septosporum NZE10]